MLSADHGESLGEHEVFFNHHGLYDEVLRVPMIYWASKPNFTPGLRIGGQVSVMDIPNTLLNGAGQLLMSNTRSENLLNRTRGVLVPLSPLLLVGREGLSLSEGWMFGVRSNNIKYIQHADGTEGFFDLDVDPLELNNMAATQPAGVQIGRNNVQGLKRLMPDAPPAVDDETQQRLRSMGYLE
jgi:arylsulfatase A-like enzyme